MLPPACHLVRISVDPTGTIGTPAKPSPGIPGGQGVSDWTLPIISATGYSPRQAPAGARRKRPSAYQAVRPKQLPLARVAVCIDLCLPVSGSPPPNRFGQVFSMAETRVGVLPLAEPAEEIRVLLLRLCCAIVSRNSAEAFGREVTSWSRLGGSSKS